MSWEVGRAIIGIFLSCRIRGGRIVTSEAAIKMAAKLYQIRDTLIILRTRPVYLKEIQDFISLVENYAEREGLGEIAAAVKMAMDPKLDDMAKMWLLSAALEINEPLPTIEAGAAQ
jgi:hypothetical protein